MEKTKRIVRSVFTYKPGLGRETPVGKSETVQGEAYTIAELMARAQQGSAPDVSRQPSWPEEDADLDGPDFEEVSRSDISERQAMINEAKQMKSAYQEAQLAGEKARKEEHKKAEQKKTSDEAERKGSSAADDDERSPGAK